MDPNEQESNASDPVVFRPVELGGAPVNLSESQVRRIPPSPPSDAPPWWTWMVPGARRAYQMRNLQAGTSEVMQLVRSIHQSLDQQIETQRLLISSMSALPEAVEGLRHVGKATEAQRELLGVLQRQMDANASSMTRFNDTLVSMDGTTKRIAERATSSETALFDLLRRAQRRMTLLTVLLVLTIAGVAALASYLLTGGTLPDLRVRKAVEAAVPPAKVPAADIPALVASPEAPKPPPEPAAPADVTPPPAAAAETPPVVPVEPVVPASPAVVEPVVVVPAPASAPAPVTPAPAPEEVKPAEPAPVTPAPEQIKQAEPAPEAATPAEPGQPTEASLRLEKLLKDLRKTDNSPPPEAPPLKP